MVSYIIDLMVKLIIIVHFRYQWMYTGNGQVCPELPKHSRQLPVQLQRWIHSQQRWPHLQRYSYYNHAIFVTMLLVYYAKITQTIMNVLPIPRTLASKFAPTLLVATLVNAIMDSGWMLTNKLVTVCATASWMRTYFTEATIILCVTSWPDFSWMQTLMSAVIIAVVVKTCAPTLTAHMFAPAILVMASPGTDSAAQVCRRGWRIHEWLNNMALHYSM